MSHLHRLTCPKGMRIRHLALLTLAASCGIPQDSEPTSPVDPMSTFPTQPSEHQAVGLTSFTGPTACADLERHIEDRAVLEMRINVETGKRYALQWFDWRGGGGGTGGGSGSISDAGSAAGGAGGGSGTSASGPVDYTTTNVQLAGVDEPDIIKNDGTRLFVASGRRLFTATTWPAANLATRGSVELGGRPFELFLDGARVVVFSHLFEPSFDGPSWCQNQDCSSWYSNATLVTHLDVSDLAHPVIVATQRVPGRYQSARRVGPTMRLVTTASMPFLDSLQTWVNWDQQQQARTREELARRFDALANFNEGQIRRRELVTWLPSALLTSGSTSANARLECSDISTTTVSARLGLTSIVSLDMNDPLAFSRQTLLASVDELYQGPDSLYLAQRHWWWWGNSTGTEQDQTYLYRFELGRADRVNFVAAGRLAGRPLDQFSFDERNGVLRVATTVTSTSGEFGWQTVNRVVTLDAALVELGRTVDLAPGERIMSTRFIDDLAYVVTFRQTDPLFVIDLGDPANPHKVGELKIPGFSSYLHPLDATHLLTIGTYIPEQGNGWERQLQLQIFDVSDPTQPRQTFTQLVGHAWGWSEAQWNHKAFNYFGAKGLLAVPFADWYTDELGAYHFTSDLRVFGVDPVSGFTPKGTMEMKDVIDRQDCGEGYCWSWYWEPQVRRSVMADDYVYAISSGGVRVAHVDSLGTPIATALFTAAP